jgi:hypothetical protein
MVAIFVLGLLALSIALGSMWRGYVFSVLWGWFIVPIFHLPALGIASAIGIALVISFLTYQVSTPHGDDQGVAEKLSSNLTLSFLYPLICLLVGWVVTWFM